VLILSAMVRTVWHLQPLLTRDITGRFSADGTAMIEMNFAPTCQWTLGSLPLSSSDVVKWHWRPLHRKCQI